MAYIFTKEDINSISKTLGAEATAIDSGWSWRLKNEESAQSLVLTLHNEIELGKDRTGSLISIQTHHGYFEMHECSGFLVFEPDEIIFVNENNDLISSLIIGRKSTCSLYSNISRDILSADFASLDPAVLLSAMQLSLTEELLSEK